MSSSAFIFGMATRGLAAVLLGGKGADDAAREALARHRKLGKRFYEDAIRQSEAAEEFT